MALFITFKNKSPDAELCWHIGGGNDQLRLLAAHGDDTISIQADGHELELIEESFDGIPMPKNGRVKRWYGETARFIIGNL